MKKVSVIVPCYNATKYLNKCVDHLLHQTIGLEEMEIILVNDASTDGGETWSMITGYEKQYPDTIIAVSLEQNLRQGGARNVGISCAGGEYLIFCDADDWLLEETLEHCYRAATEYDADVVEFSGRNAMDQDATVECGNESRLLELGEEEEKKRFLMSVNGQFTLGSQFKFYRRSLIWEHQIAFVEHLMFEEPSFVVPVRLYEKRHYYLDERLYVYYLSPGSTMRSDWTREHRWDDIKVWIHIISDMADRGLLEQYGQELEYLFFSWGFQLNVKALVHMNCVLSKDEWKTLIDLTRKIIPDIRKNWYICNQCYPTRVASDELMLSILETEITEENVNSINQLVWEIWH